MFNEELVDNITDSITNLDTRVGELERKETLTAGDGIGPFRYELHVSINGDGDFTSVKAACDYVAAQPNVGVDEWLIWIHPGEYNEEPFTIPIFTTLWGVGGDVQIDPTTSDLATDFITVSDGVTLIGLDISATLDPTAQDVFVIHCQGSDFVMDDCRVRGGAGVSGPNAAGVVKCTESGDINFSDCQFTLFGTSAGIQYVLYLDIGIGNQGNFIRSCRIWRESTGTTRGIRLTGNLTKLYLLETSILPDSTDIFVDAGATVYLRATNYTTGGGAGTITYMYAAGSGSVTSVALSAPSIFTVSGSPVITAGTLALSLATQAANRVFAGPTGGAAAVPAFRALVSDDIPSLSAAKITSGVLLPSLGGTGVNNGALALTIPATGTAVLGGGSGANTRLAIWTGANTISSDAGLKYASSLLTVDRYAIVGGGTSLSTAHSGFPNDNAVLEVSRGVASSSDTHYAILNLAHEQEGTGKAIGSIFFTNREVTKRVAVIEGHTASTTGSGDLHFYTLKAGDSDVLEGMWLTEGRALRLGYPGSYTFTLAGDGDIEAAGNAKINGTLAVQNTASITATSSDTYPLYIVSDDPDVGTDGSAFGVAVYSAASAGRFFFARALGDLTTPGTVGTTTRLLTFDVRGYDGNSFAIAAQIHVEADGTIADEQVPGRFKFLTANSSGTLTEAMRIDSAQFVGIGSTNPLVKLHLSLEDAATSAVSEIFRIDHNTTGTAAAGYGTRLLNRLESSTTTNQNAIALESAWTVAAHATRTSEYRIYSVTNAGALAEVARFDGGGGATPAAANTGLMVWDVDNNTLERVTVGAAGSGGVGFKVLRIPN